MATYSLNYSSVTKKIVMALAGLFLIMFLFVHLGINLLILFDPSRELFNQGAHFMASNPLIQIMQIFLFGGFILHMILGIILQIQNWMARPVRYYVEGWSQTSFFSKFMIHTGIVVLVFLVLHMINFFFKAKFGNLPVISYETSVPGSYIELEDMGRLVVEKFTNLTYVIIYIISFLLLGFHLNHAFQSAFQSMGLNHSKYTPFIKGLGTFVSYLLTVGFMIIPLVIFFNSSVFMSYIE